MQIVQASSSGPPRASTFYILMPSSHSQEHLWPNPFHSFNFLSSPAPPCPRLVPWGPCATPTLIPLTLQVPIGLSLLLRPSPDR